eukprot:4511694-Pleurochrysis_carterae.AAC.8
MKRIDWPHKFENDAREVFEQMIAAALNLDNGTENSKISKLGSSEAEVSACGIARRKTKATCGLPTSALMSAI